MNKQKLTLILAFMLVVTFIPYVSKSKAEDVAEVRVNSSELFLLKDAAGKSNKWQYFAGILAIGDANGDGNDDVLSGALTHQFKFPSEILKNKPFLLVYDEKTQTFIIDQKFKDVAPEMMWPRRASISDLDGDGDNDIFVAGHGTDGGFVNCGEKNIYVERTSDGYVNSSNKIANISDFSHGLSTINFDQDKAQELIVFNSPYVSKDGCVQGPTYLNQSYALDYVDQSFRRLKIIAGSSDINTTEGSNTTINSSIAGDLNSDGYPDLAVGTDFEVKILYGKEKLKYERIATIIAPAEYQAKIIATDCKKSRSKCVTPYSDFIFYDFDNDGDNDIVASLLNQKKNLRWVGSYFQAIRNDGTKWTDVTLDVFGDQTQAQMEGGHWCRSLEKVDVDLDGKDDLICSRFTSDYVGETIWLYRSGSFFKLNDVAMGNDSGFKLEFEKSALQQFLFKGPQFIRHVTLNKEKHLIGVKVSEVGDSFVGLRLMWIKLKQ